MTIDRKISKCRIKKPQSRGIDLLNQEVSIKENVPSQGHYGIKVWENFGIRIAYWRY